MVMLRNYSTYKVNSDCTDVVLLEAVILIAKAHESCSVTYCKSYKEAGFTHTCVTDKDHFEKIVTKKCDVTKSEELTILSSFFLSCFQFNLF